MALHQSETVRALEQLGASRREINEALSPTSFALSLGMYFSPAKIEDLHHDGYTWRDFEVVGYERKGNWLTVQILAFFSDRKDGERGTLEFWCDGKLLMQAWEKEVYTRVEDSYRKGQELPRPKWMEDNEARKKEREALKKSQSESGL